MKMLDTTMLNLLTHATSIVYGPAVAIAFRVKVLSNEISIPTRTFLNSPTPHIKTSDW
jgi:hypothetical protein